jgi:hypothetical protein
MTMAGEFTLVKAFVEMSTKGQKEALAALSKVHEAGAKTTKQSKEMASHWDEAKKSMAGFHSVAAFGFAAATASITGFVAAASPMHFNTLTGSVKLLSVAIGQSFVPYIEKASEFIQDVANYIHDEMDPALKSQIASWIMWGTAGMGAVVVGGRLIAMYRLINAPVAAVVRAVISFTSALNASVAASAGASGAATKLLGSLGAFAKANPVGVLLGIVGVAGTVYMAIRNIASGFDHASESIGQMQTRLAQLESLAESLEHGGPLGMRQVQQAFAGNAEALQALQAAQGQGPQAFRAAVQQQIQSTRQRLSGFQRLQPYRVHVQAGLESEGFRNLENQYSGENLVEAQRQYLDRYLQSRLGANAFALGTHARDIGALGAGAGGRTQDILQVMFGTGTALQAQLRVLERLTQTGGLPQQGRHGPLHGQNPLMTGAGQLVGIEQAWARIQQAAMKSPLEQRTEQWQHDSLVQLERIADAVGAPQPTGPPPPPAAA